MKKADSNITLMRVVSTLALMLFASGCEQPMQASSAGNVDEIPLLVRFEMKDASWCPAEVLQVVESCVADRRADDLACREKGQKIIWLAVTGASPPYQRGENPPEFGIVFKDKNDDPIENPRGGQCKDSRDGVLDCKIKRNTSPDTYHGYSVVAGACSLDPRIYVP